MRTAFAALSVLATLALPAAAQQAPAACGPRAQVVALLTGEFGETRRGLGLAGDRAAVELWASAETGSWTLTVTLGDGRTCLIARGTDFVAMDEAPGRPS